MSRQDHLFQITVNKLIKFINNEFSVGDLIPNDSEISRQFEVSRSTVRKTLDYLESKKFLEKQGSRKRVTIIPGDDALFDIESESGPKEELVERHFIQLIRSGQIKPGDRFSELELARQSNCNTVTVREFLIRFSRFGLIEKKPRSQWFMKSFDEEFVDELYELRHLFEMNALSNFMMLPLDRPEWQHLNELLEDHKLLNSVITEKFKDFAELDRRFHTLLQNAKPNQFITQFYDIISFIFHYHYQWDNRDELIRNGVAVSEHIDIISKMLMQDIAGATVSMEKHLNTARRSLKNTALASLETV